MHKTDHYGAQPWTSLTSHRTWTNRQNYCSSTFWSFFGVLEVKVDLYRVCRKQRMLKMATKYLQNVPPQSLWMSPSHRTWMNRQKKHCSTFRVLVFVWSPKSERCTIATDFVETWRNNAARKCPGAHDLTHPHNTWNGFLQWVWCII